MKNIFSFLLKIPEVLEEKRLFLFIIDGLGSLKLNLKNFRKREYETVFPSSTPNFFYSFHSLLQPQQHGFLEWYMRFKNTIVTIPPWKTLDGKSLELGKDVKRKDVFPFKSLSEILHEKGFSSIYYTPYSDSTFTKAVSKKAEVIKLDFLSQVFPLKNADFTFIYWPSVDVILHERYKDDAYEVEVRLLENFILMLKKRIPEKSVLVVMGDHGLTYTSKRYKLPTMNEEIPVGGGRVAFYRIEKEEVEKEIRKKKIKAKIFEMNEIFKGRINKRCVENFGKTVVVAEKGLGFKYPFETKKEKKEKNLGSHGGMSKEEMRIIAYLFEK